MIDFFINFAIQHSKKTIRLLIWQDLNLNYQKWERALQKQQLPLG